MTSPILPISQITPLPAGLAISKYSRKFYDGTYKWTSEGFTNEHGVYRDFDCYDPTARAPTPLPPMDLGEYDKDVENQDSTPSTSPLDKNSTPSTDHDQRKDSLVISRANPNKFASSSPLSDYPSDISEEDPTPIKGDTAVKKTIPKESEQEESEMPEQKPTTRGVAQKVKKSAKKPTIRAMPLPPIKSLQTGSYTEGSGSSSRRRSARKASM